MIPFSVKVTDSKGDLITSETYSPNGQDTNVDISFDITIPSDGIINVAFQSSRTDDSYPNKEYWNIDNFEIVAPDGENVLSFDSPTEGTIDLSAMLAQGNDFTGGTPDSIDTIDLNGDTSLNISIGDVLDHYRQ